MSGARTHRTVRGWLAVIGACAVVGCAAPANTEVEVEVSRVALDPNSHSPVVLLEDKAHTITLPIWIGPSEANAIAMRLEGVTAPRPLTHDLIKNVFDRVGLELRRVVIRELRDSTYYAHLVVMWDGEEVEIDSRPSDAIALAMRCGQPIFVNRSLLENQPAVNLRETMGGETLTFGGVTVQGLSGELAEFFDTPSGGGVVVSDVQADPRIDLRRGDVILELNGDPVRDLGDFRDKLHAASGRADLGVQRDGRHLNVAVALSD